MSKKKSNNYSNNDLAKILDKLFDGILIVGKDGKIKYANTRAAALFNKNTRDLSGKEFGYIIIPQKVQDIQIVQEQRILFVQMLGSSIEWDSEEACLLSLRDVTEQKKGELDLQVERQKLEQSNLELSQYASMASHDLREPVRKILLHSKILIDKHGGQLKEEQYKLIEKMFKSATRLGSIIDGVARFSNIRKTNLQTSQVDLNQVIRQVLEDIEILIIEKKVNVVVEDLPMVNGDSNLLYQLFLNLTTNSIKYSRDNSTPIIKISGTLTSGTVKIVFEDNGLGFDNKYALRIFEPFQRLLTDGYDGSGIGLAIVKKVIDAHHGKITAESKLDKGTKFFIEIPQKHKNVV